MAAAPPYPGYLSPQQIQAQAEQQAQASLAPERTDLLQQQGDAAAANQHTGDAIIGLSQALAQILGGVSGDIENTYRSAATDTAAFGKGFSDGMKIAQEGGASQVNGILQNIGAPEGQMLHPGAAGSDFLYGLGGYLPATTMSREGAAFASAAKFLPATSLLQGQRDFAVNVEKGRQTQKEFERALKQLDDKYPGLLQQIVGSMNQEQLSRFSTFLQAEYLKLAAGKATGVYGGDTLPGYHLDPTSGKVVKDGWHFDPGKGRNVKDAVGAGAARNKALASFEQALPDVADKLFTGKQVPNPTFNPYLPEGPTNQKTTTQRLKPWQAYQRLWNQYAPALLRLGVKRAVIANQIKAALRSVGYTGPFTAPTVPGTMLGFTEVPRKPGGRPH